MQNYVKDRNFNINCQINGTKKKCLIDLQKMEEKLNRLI